MMKSNNTILEPKKDTKKLRGGKGRRDIKC